ncbi:MAG: DUF485 domain-containing protein [Nocardioidaceae bacterium]|nr:DUF485 domain-containing protein [Nocardioidaceae bacterium]
MPSSASSSDSDVYEEMHASSDFQELRRRFRSFVIPWTVAFLTWYLLYVLMSSFAGDFMSTKVIGNINVALIFGLLQFASTFAIAAIYSSYANRQLDPLAARLQSGFEEGGVR